jgi:hypothetical protein
VESGGRLERIPLEAPVLLLDDELDAEPDRDPAEINGSWWTAEVKFEVKKLSELLVVAFKLLNKSAGPNPVLS